MGRGREWMQGRQRETVRAWVGGVPAQLCLPYVSFIMGKWFICLHHIAERNRFKSHPPLAGGASGAVHATNRSRVRAARAALRTRALKTRGPCGCPPGPTGLAWHSLGRPPSSLALAPRRPAHPQGLRTAEWDELHK